MEFNHTPDEKYILVTFDEPSLDYSNADKFKNQAKKRIAAGQNCFVLDMTNLETMDSMGLGALVKINTAARHHGGTMLICGPNRMVRQVFQLTRMEMVFPIFEDVEQALSRNN